MEFIGKAIPHGHARILGERFDDLLPIAAVFDAVEHAPEHARGVLDRFLIADLRTRRVEIGNRHAQIVAGYLERTTRTRGGLLEDENHVLALKIAMWNASMLLFLEILSQIDQANDLL